MAILPTNTTCTSFAINAQVPSALERQTAFVSQEEFNGSNPFEISEVVSAILRCCDLQTLGRLARVNRFLNACVQAHMERLDLKDLCPNLRILDAKALGITIDDEPSVSKEWILKNYTELKSHVENGEGLTLLTMSKGLTLNQLIAIALQAGITVTCVDQIVEKHGNLPVKQTYAILITNNVFQQSRNKKYIEQEDLVAGHGCVMPTVQESVALCVFTNKVFQKCVYESEPWTYGRTSTHIDGSPLSVGGFTQDRFFISDYCRRVTESYGAGGQRKFGR